MSSFFHEEPRPGYLALSGELTLNYAHTLKELLLDALVRQPVLEIDLLNVTKIDTSGVQLLLMVKREGSALSRELSFTGFSLAVEETLELLGLSSQFMPRAVVWS